MGKGNILYFYMYGEFCFMCIGNFGKMSSRGGHIINMVRMKTCAIICLIDMSSISIKLKSFELS